MPSVLGLKLLVPQPQPSNLSTSDSMLIPGSVDLAQVAADGSVGQAELCEDDRLQHAQAFRECTTGFSVWSSGKFHTHE